MKNIMGSGTYPCARSMKNIMDGTLPCARRTKKEKLREEILPWQGAAEEVQHRI
jgi:hypothetical protein